MAKTVTERVRDYRARNPEKAREWYKVSNAKRAAKRAAARALKRARKARLMDVLIVNADKVRKSIRMAK